MRISGTATNPRRCRTLCIRAEPAVEGDERVEIKEILKMMVSGTAKSAKKCKMVMLRNGFFGNLWKWYAPERKFRAENGGLSRGTYPICIHMEVPPPPPPPVITPQDASKHCISQMLRYCMDLHCIHASAIKCSTLELFSTTMSHISEFWLNYRGRLGCILAITTHQMPNILATFRNTKRHWNYLKLYSHCLENAYIFKYRYFHSKGRCLY